MNRHNLALAVAVSCAGCLYWMGAEPQPNAIADAAAWATGASASVKVSPAVPDVDNVSTADQRPIDQDTSGQPPKVVFQPPFPDRTKLFQAPKRQGRGQASSLGQSDTSVELLGFVNVDGQRVALSIDGLVSTFAEGDKQFGIEVISIQPPAVVLKRGKQRWQASFEN